ncbi:hypothetical protein [Rhizobium sp. BK376]|uniref:hypothetical protein n=1 Tax=Rhizobium sp. BK376 TaxID=2512149 RepID=UPI0010506080|nr:hypothetical protein [Rhizobium sp. BK376]TCR76779.1 hypothetical protein EV561_11939 [Rhizobium sp. BK376]
MLDDVTLDSLIERELSHQETKNLKVREAIHPHYLTEAIQAHRAGLSRSCIIMTANAVFDDLDRKLRHLVSVNDKRRPLLQDIDNRVRAGELREMVLSTELLSNDIIEPEQSEYLNRLRAARNDSAHPSGTVFTRSEAAALLSDGIDLILGQESLSPAAFAEMLAQRLRAPNFFPDDALGKIGVVKDEVSRVTSHGYHVLVRNVMDVAMEKDDNTASENAGTFLVTCAAIDNDDLTKVIYRHLFLPNLETTKAKDDPIARLIFNFSMVAPHSLKKNLNERQKERLDAKLVALLKVASRGPSLDNLRILELGIRLDEAARRSKSALPNTLSVARSSLSMSLKLLENRSLSSLARRKLLSKFTLLAANPQHLGSATFFSFIEENAAALADSLTGGEAHRLITSIRGGRVMAQWADDTKHQYHDVPVRRRDWLKAFSRETAILEGLLIVKVKAWYEAEPSEAARNAEREQLADPTCLWGPIADGIRFECVARMKSPPSEARVLSMASR